MVRNNIISLCTWCMQFGCKVIVLKSRHISVTNLSDLCAGYNVEIEAELRVTGMILKFLPLI